MDMEKLSVTFIHPIIGNTADAKGLVNVEPSQPEDEMSFSEKSVEGVRKVKKYKDPNRTIVVTVLRHSELDTLLNRALLYPRQESSFTWLDEREPGVKEGGTGKCEGLMRTSDNLTEENRTYTFFITNYVPIAG